MIFQTSHAFTENTAVRVIDLLGTDEVQNFTARKVSGTGAFYVGNENVSPISYGFSMDSPEGIYFPNINLQINPNLYVCGDPGVVISILAWQ
jgi:hypothetical protein